MILGFSGMARRSTSSRFCFVQIGRGTRAQAKCIGQHTESGSECHRFSVSQSFEI